ncbi:MAG: PAS domain-containing protein, partial [Verrucomicrobia bacterium]|nr:PAS domain-containing protein [Verrucomicrobiota bacterium]
MAVRLEADTPMAARSSFFEKVLGRLDRLDAGELRQVLRRLAQEHSFFETLLDAIGDGVAVVDRDGRLAYYNPAAARLLGIPPESGEGEPLRRFLPALDLDGLLEGAKGPHRVVQQELEVSYPCPRFLRVVVAALDQQAAAGGG